MTVSIVTATFNAGKYIKKTILSVLAQSFQDWEWYIVDGGSTDDTLNIIKNYSDNDKRIKLIISDNDKGPAHARSIGIKKSKSKYICFIDADDLWHPDKIKSQIKFMEDNSYEFTYTLCRELQKNNNFVSILLPTSNKFTYKSYLKKRGIYAFTVIIKRKILTDDIISIWNKDAYDDTIWWLLILNKGISAYLFPHDLGLYRISEDQLSSRRVHTIKKVYGLYDKLPNVSGCKNWLFLNYLFDSAFRHFKLKMYNKININKFHSKFEWFINLK